MLMDVTLRVASRLHLIAMTMLARHANHRRQDFDDLRRYWRGVR